MVLGAGRGLLQPNEHHSLTLLHCHQFVWLEQCCFVRAPFQEDSDSILETGISFDDCRLIDFPDWILLSIKDQSIHRTEKPRFDISHAITAQ